MYITAHHCFGSRPHSKQFAENFGQGNKTENRGRIFFVLGRGAIGKIHYPVQYAHRYRPAADRTFAFIAHGFIRFKANLTFSMAVAVVFSLLGIKFDGAGKNFLPLMGNRVS